MNTVIKVENLSKQYRLGVVGTGSFAHDLNRTWHMLRGKKDPYLMIGDENDRTLKGNSDYVLALNNINFDVAQGEILGIIGRNGSGKSTLLKILSRTTSPTIGSVKIKGRVASLLEVGTGFHPELSGRENIFLNGAILGMTKWEIKTKLDEIIDFSGVERYIDTPVKRYSSGMYVRLAFSVAAHLEPELLIVDEVLAVGDIEFQKKALGKMKEVSLGDGRTVLFVSHNMTAIENLCSSAIYLEKGEILFSGDVHKCLDEYHKSNKINYSVSIEHRKDRNGNGKLKMTDFYIKNADNETVQNLKSGSDYKFTLSFQNNCYPEIFNSVIVSYALIDNKNQLVFLVRSNFTNENINVKTKSCSVICEIKDLALANGEYSLTAYIGYGEDKTYDLVENVVTVTVTGGDYFKTKSHGLPLICKNLTRAKFILEL
jgi:lipopolysaccharide transport system ATP-binding protein